MIDSVLRLTPGRIEILAALEEQLSDGISHLAPRAPTTERQARPAPTDQLDQIQSQYRTQSLT